jgi:hypothetical protein
LIFGILNERLVLEYAATVAAFKAWKYRQGDDGVSSSIFFIALAALSRVKNSWCQSAFLNAGSAGRAAGPMS